MRNYLASTLIVAVLAIGLAAGYYGGVLNTPKPTPTPSVALLPKYANVAMVVFPGVLNGSDNQLHDAFTPSNFTIYLGQTVNLTIINYDTSQHSFTSTSLGLDKIVDPAPSNGTPARTTFQFTPTRTGLYRWWCAVPCDDWAMATDPKDNQHGIIGYMGGYATVLAPATS
jgi:heme/copper-type cytochrome/quinol oxidase subunit 2